MRFRISTPSYGWNAFAWDVAIVALGVALAIGAERIVQRFYWSADARQASETIKAELTEHEVDAIERLAVQPCLKQHLNALYERLRTHPGGDWASMEMALTRVGLDTAAQHVAAQAYRAPERLWLDEAWQAARVNGALGHLPASEVTSFAEAYNRGDRMRQLQTEEKLAAARLAALAVDGPIDLHSRTELLGALAQVDHANSSMERSALQVLDYLRPVLADLPQEEVDRAIAQRIAIQRRFRGSCVRSLRLKRG
jgi:hypothetical protein